MDSLTLATLVLGLVFGAVLLSAATYIYVRHQVFALGGVVLTVFGTLLLGLSIWKSVDFSVAPNGAITASFKREIEAVRTEIVQGNTRVTNELSDLRKEVKSAATQGLSPEALSQLQGRERVTALTEKGQYKEALALDPTNTIAIMRQIQSSVQNGAYDEATSYYERLVQGDRSGVGLSVYPDLILAFAKQGNSAQAVKLVEALNSRIQQDVANGYGYYSRSQQLGWLDRDLGAKLSLLPEDVAEKVKLLRTEIQGTIAALKG